MSNLCRTHTSNYLIKMNSKTSYTLCSSSSLRTCEKFPSAIFDANIAKKLYLAQQKLRPVIEDIMKPGNSAAKPTNRFHYLSVQQYADAISAMQVLKEIDQIISEKQSGKCPKKSYNINNFNLEKRNVEVNKFGKIFVDTSILIQLIELHKTLGDILRSIEDNASDGVNSNDVNSYTQTEYSDTSNNYSYEGRVSSDKINFIVVNKQKPNCTPRIKLNILNKKKNDTKLRRQNSRRTCVPPGMYPLDQNIVLLSAHTELESSKKNLSTLPEERTSNSEAQLSESSRYPRRIRSTGSIISNDPNLKVTDVKGARKIILNCLYDLEKVRTFLQQVDVYVAPEIQNQNPVTDTQADKKRISFDPVETSNTNVEENVRPETAASNSKDECDCDATFLSDIPRELLLDASSKNSSKLIICIKGRNENDGDVQIVIRQCSECKNVGGKESENLCDKTSGNTTEDTIKRKSVEELQTIEDSAPQGEEVKSVGSSERRSGINILFDPDDPSKSTVEPPTNVEETNIIPEEKRSDEFDTEKTKLNVLFDPIEPAQSIVEQRNVEKKEEVDIKASCSQIKLYETRNLCFSTEGGEELVISLSVRPKVGGNPPGISIKDIFSESGTDVDKSNTGREQNMDNVLGSEPETTVNVQDEQQQERFIPLSRTKICSSLQFDVSVMESKMKNDGINHVNPNIVVRLKELGVNKLLRACRPVKCGRPSVLNEKIRKSLPYSASLTSLPLEEHDVDIINESVKMSMNNEKYSSVKNKGKPLTYFIKLGSVADNNLRKNIHIRYLYVQYQTKIVTNSKLPHSHIRKKLSYYINMLHDIEDVHNGKLCTVNFFEVKKYYNDEVLQNSSTSLSTKCEQIKPNEFSHTEIEKAYAMFKIIEDSALPTKDNVQPAKHRTPAIFTEYKTKQEILNSHKCKENSIKTTDGNSKNAGKKEKKKFISRIPVYKHNVKKAVVDSSSGIYRISFQSLPKDDCDKTKVSKKCNEVTDNLRIKHEFKKTWERGDLVETNIIRNGSQSKFQVYEESSDDSLELYFNNFFRDKYFSKWALCHKQSSTGLLKPRNKKSEYHCPRSHSQLSFSESKSSTRRSYNLKKGSNLVGTSENFFKDCTDHLNIPQSVINQFLKMFNEYWIKNVEMHAKEKSFSQEVLQKGGQNLIRYIKEKILEENREKLSRFLSQPNVEAGMETEDTIQFQISRRYFPKDTLIVEEDFQFIRQMSKQNAAVNTMMGYSSCDNFQNMVVQFRSNTNIANTTQKPEYVDTVKFSSSTDHSVADYNFIEKLMETDLRETVDIEPQLYYLVYHYKPALFRRVLERSKNMFKSNCKSHQSFSVEYTNTSTCSSVCEKCKRYKMGAVPETLMNKTDVIDYCLCQQISSRPTEQSKLNIRKDYSRARAKHPKVLYPVHSIARKKDPVCSVCKCSIAKCQSKTVSESCQCPTKSKQKLFKERSHEVSKLDKLKKRSKKSIGNICVPKKVDIAICTKINENKTTPKKCHCIKCKKRAPDGTCYCSHCQGVFDKSVEMKPSNADVATQCDCCKSKSSDTNDPPTVPVEPLQKSESKSKSPSVKIDDVGVSPKISEKLISTENPDELEARATDTNEDNNESETSKTLTGNTTGVEKLQKTSFRSKISRSKSNESEKKPM